MKKQLAAVLAAVLLLSLPALPAAAAGGSVRQDSFTAALPALQETPEELPLTYLNCSETDPGQWAASQQGRLLVTGCTAAPSSSPGCQEVTLELEAYMDQLDPDFTYYLMYSTICDYYTGALFPRSGTDGASQASYSTSLDYGGRRCSIRYSHTTRWYSRPEGVACFTTWRFTVPTGYNGLTFVLNRPDGGPDRQTGRPLTGDRYQPQPGDQLFRFGHSLTADGPTGGLDPQLDLRGPGIRQGELVYDFSLLNSSGAPQRGCYALAAYRLLPNGSARGGFLPLDVDLAPDGLVTAPLTVSGCGARLDYALIRFSSPAQRQEFLSAPWLEPDPDSGCYEAADQAALGRWLAAEGLT